MAIPTPSTGSPRGPIHVVGSGILGVAAAWHLHLAGFREITVIDAGPQLHGTTPAGAGFVLPAAADHNRRGGTAALPLMKYSLDFYRRLDADGHDIEFGEHGNIVLATTPEFLAESIAGIVEHPLATPGTRALTPSDIGSLTAGIVDATAITGGVLMPEAAQVTTSAAVLALTAMLEAEGVAFRYSTRVTALHSSGGRVSLLSTSVGTPVGTPSEAASAGASEDIPVSNVVLAGGAWMNRLLAPLAPTLPLLPMVATRFVTANLGLSADLPTFQSRDLGPMWLRNLDGAFSWGAAPGYRSSHLLAEAGIDVGLMRGRPVVDELIDALRAHQPVMAKVFPALTDAEPATIVQGQPTWTADGRPYVGAVPGIDGLWVVGGDNEGGVMNGPGLGRLLADVVVGSATPVAPPDAFRLDRFAPDAFPDEVSIESYLAAEGDRVAHAFTE